MMILGDFEFSRFLLAPKCSNINDMMICGEYEEYKIDSNPYRQQFLGTKKQNHEHLELGLISDQTDTNDTSFDCN